MTTLTRPDTNAGMFAASVQSVRRSRALASMLPSLLFSGVMTLVITAVMHLLWDGHGRSFVAAWMESWLTAWPIAFPVSYLAGKLVTKLTDSLVVPDAPLDMHTGLAFNDIVDASARVTKANGLTVRRNLKAKDEFTA